MAKKEETAAKVKRPTAQKRMIQSEKRALENRTFRSQVRTALRNFEEATKAKKGEATTILNQIYSLIDKGVKKGVYKQNTANRTKSRLAAHIAA